MGEVEKTPAPAAVVLPAAALPDAGGVAVAAYSCYWGMTSAVFWYVSLLHMRRADAPPVYS